MEAPDRDQASARARRVLVSICFAEVVDSARCGAELGDRRWCGLLERYHDLVRRQLRIHRGQELDTARDGFLDAFDGSACAVRCAMAVRDEVRPLGLEIRAGLHTGECERIGRKLTGLGLHIGAQVAGPGRPAEVLVSSSVRDLVAGSRIAFQERGSHARSKHAGGLAPVLVERLIND